MTIETLSMVSVLDHDIFAYDYSTLHHYPETSHPVS